MRRALPVLAAALLAAGAAQAQPASLPSHQTPNGPGDIVIPFALSTPPPVPEQRSYAQLLTLWQSAGSAYGIPWEVLGAINKIESNFGRNMGPSSAGAVGWMQFMPSTWDRWGMDANGDGVANPWSPEDAIYAAARYLAAADGQTDIERAIFAYNHADWYVRDVLELAQVFAQGGGFDGSLGSTLGSTLGPGGPGAVFRADDIEKRLAKARRAVNREQREVLRAENEVQELDTRILEAQQRAGDPSLSDEQFQAVEQEVTLLVLEQEAAVSAIARERAELEQAAAAVEELRQDASAITFSRPVSNGLGQAQFAGDYVFPVGGGPEVVSVGRTHHDYPAADIAAPEGAPLYALADSFVTKTYPTPSGRCGIGLELQLESGQRYLYCHLSYLETHVVPGAALTAGTPVGLVGSTGNSTGPHLHLQFVPVTTYPQEEPWFQSFAGVAFRWAGESAPAAAPAPARAASQEPSAPVIGFSSEPVIGFSP
jgi:murein DD-endopeptidase MepM/ murein hydrolase activator NlpD